MFKHNPPRGAAEKTSSAPLLSNLQWPGKRLRSVAFCQYAAPVSEVSIVSNRPQLSPTLSGLFGGDACAAELRGRGDPSQLLPAEAALLGRSVPKRAQEFAAGRVCARLAMAQFAILDFPIERAADRQPLWPPTLVGSITHTGDYCAAVIASRDTTAAIGLDSEMAADVKPELWPSICHAAEIDWLATLPESQRIAAATLIFSAKEAFYKCQYPLTAQRLQFHDVRIELADWNKPEGAQRLQGTFRVHAIRGVAFTSYAPFPLPGRYLLHDDLVTAAVRVPAGASR